MYGKNFIIAAAIAFTQVYGAGCGINDWQIFINSFAVGLQADPTNLNTDCLNGTASFTTKTKSLFKSFTNYSTSNWLAPVYVFQETLV